MNNYPKVYVVLINWNGYVHTAACIKSLQKSTYENFKIIVVDNGSKNNQADRIKKAFPKITLLKNKANLGYSVANNQGIKLALKNGAEYIFILNNDTVVEKNCIQNLLGYCSKNKFSGIVAPKILFYKTNIIWSLGGHHQPITTIPRLNGQGKPSAKIKKEVIKPEFLTGCALFIHKNVFNKVGMFDKDYFAYHEDIDLSYRAKNSGLELICLTGSTVWHKVSKSTKQKPDKVGEVMGYLMARNSLIYGYKNYCGIKRVYYLFAQILIKFPLYLIFKVDNLKSAKAYSHGILGGLRHILTPNKNLTLSKKYVQ